MKKFAVISLFILIASISSTVVAVTIEFTGYIDEITHNPGNLVLDQVFSGTLSYSNVPDQVPEFDTYGRYDQNTSITVDFSTETISYLNGQIEVSVTNDIEDDFWFAVQNGANQDYNFNTFGLSLGDSTASVYNSDTLPMDFDLGDFDFTKLLLYGYTLDGNEPISVTGQITQFTVVPEPATIMLLSLGGIMFRRKR